MAEITFIDGTKCTQFGVEDKNTGVNVFDRFFIDRVEVFPSSGGVNPNEEVVSQAAHGFSVGDPIYYDGANWVASDAAAEATTDADGIVSTVVDADQFIVQFGGQLLHTSGFAIGSILYVAVGGGVTLTKPSLPNFVKPAYKVLAADRILVNTQQIYVQGAP